MKFSLDKILSESNIDSLLNTGELPLPTGLSERAGGEIKKRIQKILKQRHTMALLSIESIEDTNKINSLFRNKVVKLRVQKENLSILFIDANTPTHTLTFSSHTEKGN